MGEDGATYFFKLRGGVGKESSVTLPKFLYDQGISHLIPPLVTQTGNLWATLDRFKTILYPFVSGADGYAVALTDEQWVALGHTLKQIHTVAVPPALLAVLSRERYDDRGRETVKHFLSQLTTIPLVDSVAARLVTFLHSHHDEILALVTRTEQYAHHLQTQSPPFTICHSDLHAGNLLLEPGGNFYIVDWDDPILAPKERDLMYVGGGQGFIGHTAEEEEILFYQGYGQTEVNPVALAYYRCERIVQDIAVYCEELFLTAAGGEDRARSLRFLQSNFLPGGTIEVAYQSDKAWNKSVSGDS